MNKLELMIPAGNLKSFIAAVENGADAVYLGYKKFNARRPADNFDIYQLSKMTAFAHLKNVKIYLTLNIDLKSNELKDAFQIIKLAVQIGIDAVIVKDAALIKIIHTWFQDKIELHLSTQCAVTNYMGLLFASQAGADRVVLARELEWEELCQIKEKLKGRTAIEYEIFSEGSMCFSISGRCLASSWGGGRSGNRGACMAPCRVNWRTTKDNLVGTSPFFSMKDLSLLQHLSQIRQAEVTAIKVEGRLKSAAWVQQVTKLYRLALDYEGKLTDDVVQQMDRLTNDLKKYTAREIVNAHFFQHKDLIGANKEFKNFDKEQNLVLNTPLQSFQPSRKLILQLKNHQLMIEAVFYSEKHQKTIQLKRGGKKGKIISLMYLKSLISEQLDVPVEIEWQEEKDQEFSQGTLKKAAVEIVKLIKELERKHSQLPALNNQEITFLQSKPGEIKREYQLGKIP
ncbi:MAG: U32 family peptidase, partial [Spirochaetes bacterium]|nr:U32 family peptidase [Spirochaetota bacterium]